jgi:hypothetical protein
LRGRDRRRVGNWCRCRTDGGHRYYALPYLAISGLLLSAGRFGLAPLGRKA